MLYDDLHIDPQQVNEAVQNNARLLSKSKQNDTKIVPIRVYQ